LTPDVNVLVAASREDHAHHVQAHAWLTDALASTAQGATLALLPMVAAGFVRVVTHRRIFPVPTPTAEAIAFIRVLLEAGGATMLGLGPEWTHLAQLSVEHGLAGGDITDAWIAVSVRAHHEHLVTFDRGFRRFLKAGELTVLHP
jgi:uncharacterized protein